MTQIFVVYIYCDHRKEVDIQIMKAFYNRSDALAFAEWYSSESDGEPGYSIKGTIYDAKFDKTRATGDGIPVKENMWYTRIAIDETTVE